MLLMGKEMQQSWVSRELVLSFKPGDNQRCHGHHKTNFYLTKTFRNWNSFLKCWPTLPETNSLHMKSDGWKMKFPIGMAHFQVLC